MGNEKTNQAPREPPRVMVDKGAETQSDEITIIAADGDTYTVDRGRIEVMCGNLRLPAPHEIKNEVHLPEPSEVLEILAQFLYHSPRASLPRDVEMPLALRVAETAEKYQVFLLVSECKEFMQHARLMHPAHTLSYATRFGHTDLIDENLVRDVLTQPLGAVARAMHPSVLKIWVRYYEHTKGRLHRAVEISRAQDKVACSNWARARAEFAERALGDNFGGLLTAAGMRGIVPACRCPGCERAREAVRAELEECVEGLCTYQSFVSG